MCTKRHASTFKEERDRKFESYAIEPCQRFKLKFFQYLDNHTSIELYYLLALRQDVQAICDRSLYESLNHIIDNLLNISRPISR